MAGRPWRMGWLPWWVTTAKAGCPQQTAVSAADRGYGGGWRRLWLRRLVADGGCCGGCRQPWWMEAAVALADGGNGQWPQRIDAAAPAVADEGGRD